MIRHQKRALGFLSALFILMSVLTGCQGMTLKSEKASVLALPANGIITKAQLQAIKNGGKAVTYKGSSDGINYEWTFVGSQIKNVADVNLKVSFKSADDKVIAEQAAGQKYLPVVFAQKGELAGTPTLAMNLGTGWSDGTCYFYSGGTSPSQNTETTATVNPKESQSTSSSSSETAKGTVPTSSGQPQYICNLQVVNGIGHLNLKKVSGEYFVTIKKLPDNAASTPSSSSAATSSASNGAGSASGSSGAKAGTPNQKSNAASSQGSGPSIATKNADPKNINVPDANGNNYDNGYGNGHPAPWTNPPQDKNKTVGNVTVSIRCDTAVTNWNNIRPNKKDHKVVPANGAIYATHTLPIYKNETVYDLLISICRSNNIQEEHSYTPAYKAEYIRGINNLYEFDVGQLSGWMYCVNGWYPNYGCSRYVLQNGDNVQWNYTCDLGRDLGQNWIG